MATNRTLELRLYKFHPGRRDEFAARFQGQLLPMVKRHGMEVIHHGPSLHVEDSYFMIRATPRPRRAMPRLSPSTARPNG